MVTPLNQKELDALLGQIKNPFENPEDHLKFGCFSPSDEMFHAELQNIFSLEFIKDIGFFFRQPTTYSLMNEPVAARKAFDTIKERLWDYLMAKSYFLIVNDAYIKLSRSGRFGPVLDISIGPLYEKALKLNPDGIHALNGLALLYLLRNEESRAKPLLEKVLRKEGSDFAANINLGVLLMNSGELDEAQERFEIAKQVYKENPTLLYNLVMLYGKLGKELLIVESVEALQALQSETFRDISFDQLPSNSNMFYVGWED